MQFDVCLFYLPRLLWDLAFEIPTMVSYWQDLLIYYLQMTPAQSAWFIFAFFITLGYIFRFYCILVFEPSNKKNRTG
jgi:hypothetical protein